MSRKYVLIVEDEQPVREMLGFWLTRHGFEVAQAADAESARQQIFRRRPDVVLIDWQLPGISGLDLLRTLTAARMRDRVSIIMVTARADEADRVMALDCGADDYVTKPFAPRELMARINAVLRRPTPAPGTRPLPDESRSVLEEVRRCVLDGQGTVRLAPTDLRLLEFFLANPDRAHTREHLLEHVWHGSQCADIRTVDVQVRRLRKALEDVRYDRLVQTVRGVGYRFSTRPHEFDAAAQVSAQRTFEGRHE
jgi:two-component system, OmpR family, phosphate regulon response regulator PhoB